MRSSELACRSLGLSPLGFAAPAPCICQLCGAGIPVGGPAKPFKPNPSFMDGHYLTARDAPGWSCGYCAALGAKGPFSRTQQAFFTKDKAYKFGRTDQRKWLFENLPEPPYVIVSSDTKMAHMIWKTPVSRSKDLIYLRVGWRLFRVRMPMVLRLRELTLDLNKRAIEASALKKGAKKAAFQFTTPFITSEPSVSDLAYGRIRPSLQPLLSPGERSLLYQVSLGEVWVAGVLGSPKPPVEPELINLTD